MVPIKKCNLKLKNGTLKQHIGKKDCRMASESDLHICLSKNNTTVHKKIRKDRVSHKMLTCRLRREIPSGEDGAPSAAAAAMVACPVLPELASKSSDRGRDLLPLAELEGDECVGSSSAVLLARC